MTLTSPPLDPAPPVAATPREAGVGGRPRIDALEGLRGIAVVAVLAFHSGFGWARGGYLGVSVFFTLSGFLITSLLVAEHERSGRIAFGRFWLRRTRRLLPLAGIGVVGAAVVAAVVGVDDGTRGDLLSALGQVANWRFILEEESYGDLFAAPSPVLHYWSLGVEAQFYVLFPIVAMVALRRSRRALAWTVAVLCAGSWATLALVVADGQLDLAYYSTITRGGEILAGSLLALLWARPPHGGRTPVPLTVAGIGALLVIAWACSAVAATGDGSYLAVLPVIAVATTVTIAASVRSGPVAAALAIRPLQLLGRLSYALYIVHWPVFVWLSPERTDLDQTPLAALRVGVSLLLAVAAFVLVERPILRARPAKAHPLRLGAVAASFLLLVSGATVAIVGNVEPEVDLADQAADFEVQTTRPADGPTSTQPDVTAVPPAPVVAVLGDSTALRTGMGLDAWGTETEEMQVIGGVTTLGCGIEPPGARRVYPSQVVTDMSDTCSQALARWPSAVTDSGASVAVIQVGPWDVADHQLSGTDQWQHVGEAAYDRILLDLIGSTVDQLLAAGAEHVVWIEPPPVILTRSPNYGSVMGVEGDPARMERLNEIAAEVASTRPQMRLVDLAARIERLGADDERVRPDGVHFTVETAAEVAAWLGPQILAAIRSR